MNLSQPSNSDTPQLADVLMEIANNFINAPLEKADEVINRSLELLSRFTKTDRAYVFRYDHDHQTCSNTYEWCNEGILQQIEELQNVPLEVIPDWVNTHFAGKALIIPDVLALDPDSPLRHILEPQEIKSLITLPMMTGEICTGFVGFDSVRHHHTYSDKEQQLLQLFAMMLVNLQERNNTQRALRQAIEKTEAANQAKSEFLANITHEIRTPLHSVIGYADLLKQTSLNETQQDYLHNTRTSAKILMGIINDVLDFSKIEAGMMDLVLASSDLKQIVSNSLQPLQLTAKQKNLPLVVKIDPETPRYIFTDSVRLQQVLTNLLSNAVKFTETGEVKIETRYTPETELNGSLHLAIHDTGIGITDEQKNNLFRPFTQVDASITRRYGGTGLGLIISEMITKQMGSKIEIDNSRTNGTTFYLDLQVQLASDEKLNWI
ncbi:MAG: ATP-binding protein [Bacteroidota bacterium]|jgi:signal transduction histidine kinase